VRHAMVALTKADVVDADTVELAALDVAEHLAGSPLADAPIVVCDSVSGRGIDDVRLTLDAVLGAAPAAQDRDRPRLWIDRVFTARGAGTVVTGTLTGGSLSVDQDVEAGGRRARIRGIEIAGRKVDRADPGTRVALNLAGIEHRDLARGDAVVVPAQWVTPRVVDVRLLPLPGEEIKRRGRLQAHVGSGEGRVWLRVLDGDGAFARLRFDDPVPLAPGDRLVLRDAARKRTVAGAEVLDIEANTRAKDAPARLALPLGERLLAARPWLPVGEIPRLAGCSEQQTGVLVDELLAAGAGARVGDWIVSAASLAQARQEATARALAHHAAHPTDAGVELAAIENALRVTGDQLRAALADEPDVVVERGVVRHVSHTGSAFDTPDAPRVLAAFNAAPFAPPAPKDIDVDPALIRALVREGALVDVDNVVFSAYALAEARARVVDALRERGHLSVADIRDMLGSTRKYVLAIVGWLDREGVTRRRGDDRHPGPTSGLGGLP